MSNSFNYVATILVGAMTLLTLVACGPTKETTVEIPKIEIPGVKIELGDRAESPEPAVTEAPKVDKTEEPKTEKPKKTKDPKVEKTHPGGFSDDEWSDLSNEDKQFYRDAENTEKLIDKVNEMMDEDEG